MTDSARRWVTRLTRTVDEQILLDQVQAQCSIEQAVPLDAPLFLPFLMIERLPRQLLPHKQLELHLRERDLTFTQSAFSNRR